MWVLSKSLTFNPYGYSAMPGENLDLLKVSRPTKKCERSTSGGRKGPRLRRSSLKERMIERLEFSDDLPAPPSSRDVKDGENPSGVRSKDKRRPPRRRHSALPNIGVPSIPEASIPKDPPPGGLVKDNNVKDSNQKASIQPPTRKELSVKIQRRRTSTSDAAEPKAKPAPLPVDDKRKCLTRSMSVGTSLVRRETEDSNGRVNPVPKAWCYSSSHILINEERANRGIPTLTRSRALDNLARDAAKAMASGNCILHSDMNKLALQIEESTGGGGKVVVDVLGENAGCGKSIRDVHKKFMDNVVERDNILDKRYTQMGFGSMQSSDGSGMLFLCQLFKG